MKNRYGKSSAIWIVKNEDELALGYDIEQSVRLEKKVGESLNA